MRLNNILSHYHFPSTANDPLSYSIVEAGGTPVPRPLLSVVASDLDGDTLTYAINPASVSIVLPKNSALLIIWHPLPND